MKTLFAMLVVLIWGSDTMAASEQEWTQFDSAEPQLARALDRRELLNLFKQKKDQMIELVKQQRILLDSLNMSTLSPLENSEETFTRLSPVSVERTPLPQKQKKTASGRAEKSSDNSGPDYCGS